MRYGVATLVSILMLLAALALGGAGHGWVAGAFGCLALVPVAFATVTNGLALLPSFKSAIALLAIGLLLCLGVAIFTASVGTEYFHHYMQTSGRAGMVIAGSAYIGWFVIAVLAIIHARRVLRQGS